MKVAEIQEKPQKPTDLTDLTIAEIYGLKSRQIQRITKAFLHIFYTGFWHFIDKIAQIQAQCGFRGVL